MNLTTGYPYWLINSGLPNNYPKLEHSVKTDIVIIGGGISGAKPTTYIGLYDKTPHTYYALGFGGNGITFSVIAAQIIRDMVTGKKNKDAAMFAFNR